MQRTTHAGNSFQFRSSGHSSSDSSDCWCWSTGNFRCFGSPCHIGTVNKFQVSKKTIWCFSSHFNIFDPKSSLTLGYYAPKSLTALEFPLKTTQITFDPLRQRLVGGFCTFETAQLFVQLVGGWPTGGERKPECGLESSLVSCCFSLILYDFVTYYCNHIVGRWHG